MQPTAADHVLAQCMYVHRTKAEVQQLTCTLKLPHLLIPFQPCVGSVDPMSPPASLAMFACCQSLCDTVLPVRFIDLVNVC